MTADKRRQTLLLLVAGNLAALVAMLVLMVLFDGPIGHCASTAVTAQWLLVPFWAAFGTSRLFVRCAGSLLGFVFFVLSFWIAVLVQVIWIVPPVSALSLVSDISTSIGLQIAQLVAIGPGLVTAGLLVMRWAGLRLVCFAHPIAAHGPMWPQFSLKLLLVLTFAIAVALSLGSAFRSWNSQRPETVQLLMSVVGGIESAVITCLVVWAVLSPAPPAARIALANLLAALVALLPAYYFRAPVVGLPEQLLANFIMATCLSASLLVVRTCGYRAIWPADWVWAAGLADELRV